MEVGKRIQQLTKQQQQQWAGQSVRPSLGGMGRGLAGVLAGKYGWGILLVSLTLTLLAGPILWYRRVDGAEEEMMPAEQLGI